MKFLTRYIALILLALCSQVGAYDYRDEIDGCESRCNIGCGDPLVCGAWDIQVQGGFNPIRWRQTGNVSAIECPGTGTPNSSVIVPLFAIPKYNKFFRHPWVVGLQVGYALSDDLRLYGEFNYVQSRAKNNSVFAIGTTLDTLQFTSLGKYRLYDGHIGLRYYSPRWCERTSFFLGGKVGIVHHRGINFNANFVPGIPGSAIPLFSAARGERIFNSRNAVSGGLNAGLDICLGCNFSFVLTGEVVASCGPSSNSPLFVSSAPLLGGLPYNNLIIGSIGTELRFPITAGIRYIF